MIYFINQYSFKVIVINQETIFVEVEDENHVFAIIRKMEKPILKKQFTSLKIGYVYVFKTRLCSFFFRTLFKIEDFEHFKIENFERSNELKFLDKSDNQKCISRYD